MNPVIKQIQCVCEQIKCEHYFVVNLDTHIFPEMRCKRVTNDDDKPYYIKSGNQDIVLPMFSDHLMRYYENTLGKFKLNCPHYNKILLISRLEKV